MLHTAVIYDVQPRDRAVLEPSLAKLPELAVTYTEQPLNEETVALAAEAEIISVFVSSPVNAQLLQHMPQLKLILTRSTGFNHIDVAAATSRQVTVCNVPTYGEHTVAEYTFALLLSLSRKLPQVIAAVKQGQLEHEGLTGFDLAGKTLGIIGTGHIGQQVARIAKGFGMNLLGYDPFPNQEAASQLGLRYVGLPELLAGADIITLHAPYTKQNHHLLDAEAFAKVKPGALLINTARGELVDTKALLAALHGGQLGGAALDVLEGEELLGAEEEMLLLRPGAHKAELLLVAEQSLLQKLPNVILSNHNAFNSVEALAKINTITVENLQAYLQGRPVNVVKPS